MAASLTTLTSVTARRFFISLKIIEMNLFIKPYYGVAILGVCSLITLFFIDWTSRQIGSFTLSVSHSSQMAAVSDFDSNLVAHYTFDDGTATDSSGNGNNGTVNGAVAVE